MGESLTRGSLSVFLLILLIGDPDGVSVLSSNNWPAAKMACLLHSSSNPHSTLGFTSDMLACYTDNTDGPRCENASRDLLGCDRDDNVLLSSCSVVGY
jgi:hypothetical protein